MWIISKQQNGLILPEDNVLVGGVFGTKENETSVMSV